jgi:hypothetical protein
MNKKSFLIYGIILSGLILFSGFAYAMDNCPPVGPPKVFSGNVYYSGNLLSGTYTLSAVISGQVIDQVIVSGGKYSDLQVSPCSGVTGEISFIVNGVKANETSTWNNNRDNDWGQQVTLDLNLNEKPNATSLCGNNLVNLGEECDGANLAGRTSCGDGWEGTISCTNTCVVDYSNCTKIPGTNANNPSTSPSGGSSTTSPGGGGSSTTSDTNTKTTNSDGTQKDSGSNSGNSSGFEDIETKGNFFKLTGAAISNFSKSKAGKSTLIVLLIVMVLGGVYYSAKKASGNQAKKKPKKKSVKKKTAKKKSSKGRKIKIVKLSDLKKSKK